MKQINSTTPINFGQLRRHWRQQFAEIQIESAAIDSRLLLCAAAEIDQAQLIGKEHDLVSPEILARMDGFGQRRLAHEPVARILGEAAFYGRVFSLNADTLVPRPDTEVLVELGLQALPKDGHFIDLGTGTGCIAISLLAERGDCTGVATDIAAGALEMARKNAARHEVSNRLELVSSNWFDAIPAQNQFDLILSNPPYIAEQEKALMNKEALDYDPALALFAEDEGMAAYHQILAGAKMRLRQGGKLLFEIGFRQAELMEKSAIAAGAQQVTFFKDLSGHNRVAEISW